MYHCLSASHNSLSAGNRLAQRCLAGSTPRSAHGEPELPSQSQYVKSPAYPPIGPAARLLVLTCCTAAVGRGGFPMKVYGCDQPFDQEACCFLDKFSLLLANTSADLCEQLISLSRHLQPFPRQNRCSLAHPAPVICPSRLYPLRRATTRPAPTVYSYQAGTCRGLQSL
jgi:hypothetical protein